MSSPRAGGKAFIWPSLLTGSKRLTVQATQESTTMKVSDYILQRLREWDVDRVVGYAGDGINGLLAAWGRAENDPQFIQARHEEMAAFEATGYAKFSGRVGVCAATSGPGAVHLLNGLYDAKLEIGRASCRSSLN